MITAHRLTIAPYQKTEKNADLLDAMAVLLQSFPDLNEAGYAGYGYWYRNLREVFVNNATSGYKHGIWTICKTKEEAEATFAPVRKALSKFESELYINETYITYDDYWSLYDKESGQNDPAGDTWALTSRMITRDAVSDHSNVRETVEVVSGKPEEYASNFVLMVSDRQVYEDAKDTTLLASPSMAHVAIRPGGTWRNPARNATNTERKAMNDDITFVKGAAAKKLAPNNWWLYERGRSKRSRVYPGILWSKFSEQSGG